MVHPVLMASGMDVVKQMTEEHNQSMKTSSLLMSGWWVAASDKNSKGNTDHHYLRQDKQKRKWAWSFLSIFSFQNQELATMHAASAFSEFITKKNTRKPEVWATFSLHMNLRVKVDFFFLYTISHINLGVKLMWFFFYTTFALHMIVVDCFFLYNIR